ncbi:hypothetical protein BMT17_22215 [Bacillus thuringiensis serovar kurstaki]|nr:hypothetical protein BMT17_22215 [Bacillus thuringiensis serovar kurstaki]
MKHYEQALRTSQQKQQEMRQKCEQLATSMQQLEQEIHKVLRHTGKMLKKQKICKLNIINYSKNTNKAHKLYKD